MIERQLIVFTRLLLSPLTPLPSFAILVLLMDIGHLFKNTETVVLAWGTDGVWFTNAEAIANTTSIAGDAPWDVTRHTYLRSVAATRFALSAAYLFVDLRRSITNPDEVLGYRWVLSQYTTAASYSSEYLLRRLTTYLSSSRR